MFVMIEHAYGSILYLFTCIDQLVGWMFPVVC